MASRKKKPQTLQEIFEQKRDLRPQNGQVVELWMEAFGGIKGFVQFCHDEIQMMEAGSTARQRMLGQIMELIMHVNDKEGEEKGKSAADMSDEELDEYIETMMESDDAEEGEDDAE